MYALAILNGWGSLLMIGAIFGWSALMLLLVYLITKLWRPGSPRSGAGSGQADRLSR